MSFVHSWKTTNWKKICLQSVIIMLTLLFHAILHVVVIDVIPFLLTVVLLILNPVCCHQFTYHWLSSGRLLAVYLLFAIILFFFFISSDWCHCFYLHSCFCACSWFVVAFFSFTSVLVVIYFSSCFCHSFCFSFCCWCYSRNNLLAYCS